MKSTSSSSVKNNRLSKKQFQKYLEEGWKPNLQLLEELQRRKNTRSQNAPGKKDLETLQKEKKILSLYKRFLAKAKNYISEQALLLPNEPSLQTPASERKCIKINGPQKKSTWNHVAIGEKLGFFLLSKNSQNLSSKFVIYQQSGAHLLRHLQEYCLNFNVAQGYTEFSLPTLLQAKQLEDTGQLPKFADDIYAIPKDNLYLSPTGEVPLMNVWANQILPRESLPCKMTTFSRCYRREAGATSKQHPGILRLHEFHKVEIVQITEPTKSAQALEEMLQHVQQLLEDFALPYRVILLPTPELGFAAAQTYDVEVWFPAMQQYVEIASISNTTDFQTSKLNIKITQPDTKKKIFPHGLNGSALALDRLLAAILENHFDEASNSLKIDKLPFAQKTLSDKTTNNFHAKK